MFNKNNNIEKFESKVWFRQSSIQGVMKRIKAKGAKVAAIHSS